MLSITPVTKVFYYIPLEVGNILVGWMGTVFYLALTIILASMVKPITHNYSVSVVIGSLGVITFGQVIASILLIIGTMKKSHLLLLPWLLGQVLIIICLFVIAIGKAITGTIIIALCYNLVITFWIIFQGYLLLCGYSMYEKIRFNKENGPYGGLREETSVGEGV